MKNNAQQWVAEVHNILESCGMDVIFCDEEFAEIEDDGFPVNSDLQLEAESAYLNGETPEEFLLRTLL